VNLTILSADEIQAIHSTTLGILENIGVQMDDPEARSILCDHGAVEKKGRIFLPADLIEGLIKSCPAQVRIAGRDGSATLGGGSMHVHNLGGAREVLDFNAGTIRPASSKDVATSARLLDALENVTTVTPLYTPQDVPSNMVTLAMFDQTIRHTLKPINGPGVHRSSDVGYLAEMMKVVCDDQESISLGVSPISPLKFPREITQTVIEIARRNIPLGPLPCPSLGLTAPITMAGALAQQNAENLATIALTQAVQPGLPIIYCGRLAPANMRSFGPAWGNPETGLAGAATVQLGHYYGLPVNVYGLSCSTYGLDIQNGYERALNALVPALAGADELSGIGEMAGGILSCPEQMVIDNEIISMVRRLISGFKVDADTLALQVIEEVMNGNHSYAAEMHTVRHLRAGEVWRPTLAVQQISWDEWCLAGRETVVQHAQEKVMEILVQHDVPPLSEEQADALDEILEAARQQS